MFYFLGPKSEQRAFLEEVFQLIFTDHAFWRRNFYPKDPPALSFQELQSAESTEFKEDFYQKLFSLISDLKLDVPFFSPRYMGHIVSEPSLPGLVAYIATMFYNPNNVSKEASPVTLHYELEAGRQLASLFGFDEQRCFAHLTSGGTVANYESIWFHKTSLFLPLTLHWACEKHALTPPQNLPNTQWELLNVSPEKLESIWGEFTQTALQKDLDPYSIVQDVSPAALGDRTYWQLQSERWGTAWRDPVVLVPHTAHYSWQRAASVFGLGRNQFLEVEIDEHFCMQPESYQRVLRQCREEQIPVLQTVTIVGTTEFGNVDPLDQIVRIRDAEHQKGLYSPIHVDAAFGGYFASMFKEGTQPIPQEQKEFFEQHSTPDLLQRFQAIESCESVTIDPHKMGYAPYGAGAFVLKHGFQKAFVAQSAAYCFDERISTQGIHLGQYILEGSKPGAAAAAVWFSHSMIPLNTDGYGTLLYNVCRQTQALYSALFQEQENHEHEHFMLIPVLPPQLNVVGFFVWPRHAKRFSEVNRFNHALIQRFGVRDVESIQQYDYLISHTKVPTQSPYVQQHPILSTLEQDSEQLEVMRLVLMNSWHDQLESKGTRYIDDFIELLVEECEKNIRIEL